MMAKSLAPSVQHGQKTDLRTKVSRISRDGAQRLSGAGEQQVVNDALIL